MRRREHIKDTLYRHSPWLAAGVQCRLRNGTSDEEAQRVLAWLCDPDGGGHSCHGIKEGGSHYHPVHPQDHLEWAMTSLHEMHEGKESNGFSTCWFGGIAYLVVRSPSQSCYLSLLYTDPSVSRQTITWVVSVLPFANLAGLVLTP